MIVAGKRGRRYKQTFRANMTQKEEPTIVPYSGSDFTCVTFKPELKRFGMDRYVGAVFSRY